MSLPIFSWKQKHAKALSLVFPQMLMVHFVGTPHCLAIAAGGISENLEPLVDKDIMHKEIGKAVRKYPYTYGKPYFQHIILP